MRERTIDRSFSGGTEQPFGGEFHVEVMGHSEAL